MVQAAFLRAIEMNSLIDGLNSKDGNATQHLFSTSDEAYDFGTVGPIGKFLLSLHFPVAHQAFISLPED